MGKKIYSISLTQEAWDRLGRFAKEMGTTRSGLIEIMSKYLDKGEGMTVGQLLDGVFKDVLEIFKSGRGPGNRVDKFKPLIGARNTFRGN